MTNKRRFDPPINPDAPQRGCITEMLWWHEAIFFGIEIGFLIACLISPELRASVWSGLQKVFDHGGF